MVLAIDFDKLSQDKPSWFEYSIDDDTVARLEIKFLTSDVCDAIDKRCNKSRRANQGFRKIKTSDIFDTPRARDERVDEALVGWDFVDQNAHPIPCTSENKLKVMSIYTEMRDYVIDVAQTFTVYQSEKVEEEKKISDSGDSITSTENS